MYLDVVGGSQGKKDDDKDKDKDKDKKDEKDDEKSKVNRTKKDLTFSTHPQSGSGHIRQL